MTYKLPLLGHDMPYVAPKGEKARVYKRGELDWAWHHACATSRPFMSGGLHPTQGSALDSALQHLKGCS